MLIYPYSDLFRTRGHGLDHLQFIIGIKKERDEFKHYLLLER